MARIAGKGILQPVVDGELQQQRVQLRSLSPPPASRGRLGGGYAYLPQRETVRPHSSPPLLAGEGAKQQMLEFTAN